MQVLTNEGFLNLIPCGEGVLQENDFLIPYEDKCYCFIIFLAFGGQKHHSDISKDYSHNHSRNSSKIPQFQNLTSRVGNKLQLVTFMSD